MQNLNAVLVIFLLVSWLAAKVACIFLIEFADNLRIQTGSPVGHEDPELRNLRPIQKLDLERFMGLWYEVGRLDDSYQRGQIANTGKTHLFTNDCVAILTLQG